MAICEHCAITISIPSVQAVALAVVPPPKINVSIGCGGVRHDAEIYDGEYIVTPLPWDQTILETAGKLMADDVTVLEIPYYRTSNLQGGDTIYIGMEADNG